MESPIIIFDHVNKLVTVAQQGAHDTKVDEALAAQREQVTSAGGAPAR
jgi:hypothetical protein